MKKPRGRTSILRDAMKDLLQQYKATGLPFSLAEQIFGAVDRRRLIKLLDNLRASGEAHCKRSKPGVDGLWFPGAENPDREPTSVSPTDYRRIKLARQADQSNPIVFYGQRLAGGRCASVWEYARHHQEQRA